MYKYNNVHEFIKEHRDTTNSITGQPNMYLGITDEMVWKAAREEVYCEQIALICCIDMMNCRGDESTCRHIKKQLEEDKAKETPNV